MSTQPHHPLYPCLNSMNWNDLWAYFNQKKQIHRPENQILLIYLRAYRDFEFFVQYFFPDYCPFPFSQMHLSFFEAETDPQKRNRRDVIAAPRGNAKTTFKVLFKVLHAIVYEYERFILIIGHSAPEAEAKVRDILDELMQNPRLRQVYGELAPIKGQGKANSKAFITQNGVKVMAKSRGQEVRGLKHGAYRPSFIILDDVEAPERVLNEEQRYKTQQWFEKDILKLGAPGGGTNIILIGTCLHPESLLTMLLQAPGWQAQKYQAIQKWSQAPHLWEQWKTLFTDLSDPNREATAQAFYDQHEAEMIQGTQVLWPEAEPYLFLMKMRVNEGVASFNSEKQNDPHDPNRQVFDMTLARRFSLVVNQQGVATALKHETGKVVEVAELIDIVAFHDPALGESLAHDYAAIVVVAQDSYGYLYRLDAWLEKAKPDRQIQQAFKLQAHWGFDRLYLEDNNFQGLLKMNYRDQQHDHPEQSLRVIGVTQHQNKEKRISTLEPLISNGHLLFAEKINPLFMQQLLLFPTSHDDGPDALHGAVAQLKRGQGRIQQVRYGTVPS